MLLVCNDLAKRNIMNNYPVAMKSGAMLMAMQPYAGTEAGVPNADTRNAILIGHVKMLIWL